MSKPQPNREAAVEAGRIARAAAQPFIDAGGVSGISQRTMCDVSEQVMLGAAELIDLGADTPEVGAVVAAALATGAASFLMTAVGADPAKALRILPAFLGMIEAQIRKRIEHPLAASVETKVYQ